jgi:hypothetical protein
MGGLEEALVGRMKQGVIDMDIIDVDLYLYV